MPNQTTTDTVTQQTLAIHGGAPAIENPQADEALFHWPIVTEEDEAAVIDVLRAGTMSGTAITKQFEAEFAQWQNVEHALAACNGTAALLAAMWACGVGAGDEIICPSMTYWASAAPALSLGAAVNFADIEAESLCIDPDDIEHRIGPRTRAIVVVHYGGHPADMDRIMPIAQRHGVRVIEDVSHAQGTLYRGRMCGTIGDIGAMSLMAGKSLVAGEAGMIVTNDSSLYERCVAFGHYERTGGATLYTESEQAVQSEGLRRFSGLPLGGVKHRLNQTAAAMGRVQLRHYPQRIGEIDRAMNRFWSLLADVPGLRPCRPDPASGSTMGGWYASKGLYDPEAFNGVPVKQFCAALHAEGLKQMSAGTNFPLHLHAVFHEADIFNQGAPTMVAFGQRDVRQGPGSLPVAEGIAQRAFRVPWFKHDQPERIALYAAAVRKVATQAASL